MLSALLCAAAALAAAGGRSPPMPRHPGHGSRRMQNSATDVRVQPQVADAPVAWSGSGSWAWGWELGEHNEGPHAIFTPFTVALVAITCVVGIIPLAAHYAAKVKPQHPPKFWKPPEMRRDASDWNGSWPSCSPGRPRWRTGQRWPRGAVVRARVWSSCPPPAPRCRGSGSARIATRGSSRASYRARTSRPRVRDGRRTATVPFEASRRTAPRGRRRAAGWC
eukprot:TRINITY_DN28954_c0_g1_i1.p2 TRINITY_DN28954_c0_g1~~TRINITY_DN28954_c0_g1_i1.p2  ORF type:complete len:244 (+),score=26.42 TRINITY_DN28954_c0_g1_i1:67-732(+)